MHEIQAIQKAWNYFETHEISWNLFASESLTPICGRTTWDMTRIVFAHVYGRVCIFIFMRYIKLGKGRFVANFSDTYAHYREYEKKGKGKVRGRCAHGNAS